MYILVVTLRLEYFVCYTVKKIDTKILFIKLELRINLTHK